MKTRSLAFAVVALCSLLSFAGAAAAGNIPLGAPVRGNRAFEADAGGKVRINVIFRNPPGQRERSVLSASRGRLKKLLHLIPAATMEVDAADLSQTLAVLEGDASVLLVEPDNPDLHISVQSTPWGVERVQGTQVFAYGEGGAGVKVGVLDTGIDYTHPDLAANYRGGHDFVNNDADPRDDNGHGTHVAGTIAAVNNAIGVVGVAPEAELYALKFLDARGQGYTSDFAEGLQWAVDHGIKVVNVSAGTFTDSNEMHKACDSAYQAGVVIIAASGNESLGMLNYPAAYDSVIAVGALDSGNQRAYFSNYGAGLDVMAPGVGVLSTFPGGGYATADGTSMATPHVTGVAALIAGGGVWVASKIYSRLRGYALDLGAAGFDDLYGYGLVQAVQAVYRRGFLLAPAGGEILPSGGITPLAWTAPDGAAVYRLEYSLNGGASWALIQDGWGSVGYDWTVPAPKLNRRNCLVRVWAFDATGDLLGIGQSAAPFAIEVVRLDSPNGGESWISGESRTVSWTVNVTIRPVNAINIQLSRDDGATWEDLATLPGDATSWEWGVTAVNKVRRRCLVKVTLRDLDNRVVGRDSSDAKFTLNPAPTD